MKSNLIFPFLTLLCGAMLLSSFSKKGKKFKPPKSFVYIPSGTVKITPNQEAKFSIKGFFMKETEVSNLEYNEFLNDLQAKGKTEDYQLAKRTPENWQKYRTPQYGEPFTNNYHQHPAYDDYPVMTISQKGAKLYCKWLTEVWQKKYPKVKINFRLPTEREWEYAARGGHEHAPFPWGGYYYRNAKGKVLANFKMVSGLNIRFNKKTQAYETIGINQTDSRNMPAPAKSFFPNDFGLYNMSGNAAEMIKTPNRTKGGSYNSTAYHIQIQSEDEYEGWTEPSPYIGFRPLLEVAPKE